MRESENCGDNDVMGVTGVDFRASRSHFKISSECPDKILTALSMRGYTWGQPM